jgi:hypothetical protein
MSDTPVYIVKNGECYILVEQTSIGREEENLKLSIKMAKPPRTATIAKSEKSLRV